MTIGEAKAMNREGREAGRPAVFLDRDGTIIEHVHYIGDPADVRLFPGASGALKALRGAGFALVVVTNQSAVGRGKITEAQVHLVNDEMGRQLASEGASVDAVYFCPDVPTSDDRTAILEGSRRKPGPGMLLAAAADLGLDLSRSWMVGDMISDVLAGRNAGCRGSLLVLTGKTITDEEAGQVDPGLRVADLMAAADRILSGHRDA